MAKVNMFFFFGLLVYLSTLLHDATARGRKRLFSKRVNFKEILLPYPLTGPIMFCAGPNILSRPKNLTAFSASIYVCLNRQC